MGFRVAALCRTVFLCLVYSMTNGALPANSTYCGNMVCATNFPDPATVDALAAGGWVNYSPVNFTLHFRPIDELRQSWFKTASAGNPDPGELEILQFDGPFNIGPLNWCLTLGLSTPDFATEDGGGIRPTGLNPGGSDLNSQADITLFERGIRPSFFPPLLHKAYVAFYAEGDSGGHESAFHDQPRPMGNLDTGGLVFFRTITDTEPPPTVTYNANQFSGRPQIYATVSATPFASASLPRATLQDQAIVREALKAEASAPGFGGCSFGPAEIVVQVPNLEPLPVDADVPSALGSGPYRKVGGTPQHRGATDGEQYPPEDNNHYGRLTTHHAVYKISKEYDDLTWFSASLNQMRIQDMSLPFGGKFDVKDPAPGGQWGKNAAHRMKFGHSNGRAVDISFSTYPLGGWPFYISEKASIHQALINEHFTEESFDTANPDASAFKSKGFFDESDHFHVMR